MNRGMEKLKLVFNQNGQNLYVVHEHGISDHKLAFPWNVRSTYKGSKFLYLMKRFFTTLRIREYKIPVSKTVKI